MQMIFARDSKGSNAISEERLHINNCGLFSSLNENLKTTRPQGRMDYHLIFVHKGTAHTNFGKATKGQCVYYEPHTPQRYEYIAEEKCAYFWIHYSGKEAEKIFENIRSGILDCNANAHEVHELFFRTVRSLQDGFFEAESYALNIFQAMCALVRGNKQERNPFRSIITMMQDFSVKYTITDYAREANMSNEHFIRTFKAFTGKTPLAYRTNLMLAHAKNLLTETPLEISTVAEQCGFFDSLYFSRVFKKHTGVSPTDFRHNAITPPPPHTAP